MNSFRKPPSPKDQAAAGKGKRTERKKKIDSSISPLPIAKKLHLHPYLSIYLCLYGRHSNLPLDPETPTHPTLGLLLPPSL